MAAGTNSGAAKILAGSISRRQMLLRSAIALGGLAIAPMLPSMNVCAKEGNGNAAKSAQLSQRDIDALSGASLLYIATIRKDGNQSTPAPVWFTISPDLDSDATHHLEGQAHPTWQSSDRLDW